MNTGIFGRRLAAGALALYALVVGVLVPLHGFLEVTGPRSAPVAGLSVVGECTDQGCQDPSHHHHVHPHDPATCVTCSHARTTAASAPAVAVAAPVPVRVGAASVAASAPDVAADRAIHPARGPPVLS